MKRIASLLLTLSAFSLMAYADDKPVTFEQLPEAAQKFITSIFPKEKIAYAVKDDDIIRPDYEVRLMNGAELDFDNSGKLEKIEMKNAPVPSGVVPAKILDYVKANYPEAFIMEYEVDSRDYEVKLSNRTELKFNKNFQLIGIDD